MDAVEWVGDEANNLEELTLSKIENDVGFSDEARETMEEVIDYIKRLINKSM